MYRQIILHMVVTNCLNQDYQLQLYITKSKKAGIQFRY